MDKESKNNNLHRLDQKEKGRKDNEKIVCKPTKIWMKADGDMIQNGGATVWQEEVNKKLDSFCLS